VRARPLWVESSPPDCAPYLSDTIYLAETGYPTERARHALLLAFQLFIGNPQGQKDVARGPSESGGFH
jgi:hypothetical protein